MRVFTFSRAVHIEPRSPAEGGALMHRKALAVCGTEAVRTGGVPQTRRNGSFPLSTAIHIQFRNRDANFLELEGTGFHTSATGAESSQTRGCWFGPVTSDERLNAWAPRRGNDNRGGYPAAMTISRASASRRVSSQFGSLEQRTAGSLLKGLTEHHAQLGRRSELDATGNRNSV